MKLIRLWNPSFWYEKKEDWSVWSSQTTKKKGEFAKQIIAKACRPSQHVVCAIYAQKMKDQKKWKKYRKRVEQSKSENWVNQNDLVTGENLVKNRDDCVSKLKSHIFESRKTKLSKNHPTFDSEQLFFLCTGRVNSSECNKLGVINFWLTKKSINAKP